MKHLHQINIFGEFKELYIFHTIFGNVFNIGNISEKNTIKIINSVGIFFCQELSIESKEDLQDKMVFYGKKILC